jgi:hypothetical protein
MGELFDALSDIYEDALERIRTKLDALILSADASEKAIETALTKGFQEQSNSFEQLYDTTLSSVRNSILAAPDKANELVNELGDKVLATAEQSSTAAQNILTEISTAVREPLNDVLQDVLANIDDIEDVITLSANKIDNTVMLLRAEVLSKIESEIRPTIVEIETDEKSLWDKITNKLTQDADDLYYEPFDIIGGLEQANEQAVKDIEDEANALSGPIEFITEGIGSLVQGLKDSLANSVNKSIGDLITSNRQLQFFDGPNPFGTQGDLYKEVVESVLTPLEDTAKGGINIQDRDVPEGPLQLNLDMINVPTQGGFPILGAIAGMAGMLLVAPTLMEFISSRFTPTNEAIQQNAYLKTPTKKLDASTLILLLQRGWFGGFSQDLKIDLPFLDIPGRKTEAQNPDIPGANFVGMTDELRRQGYNKQQILALASLSENFIGISELLRLFNAFENGTKTEPDGEVHTITEAEVDERLYTEGYAEKTQDWIKLGRWIWPSVQDVVRFAIRDVWEPDIMEAMGTDTQPPEDFYVWAKKAGINKDSALLYWRAHYDLPPFTVMRSSARRRLFGLITPGIYDDNGIQNQDAYDKIWQMWFKAADLTPKLGVLYKHLIWQPITRVDIRRLDRLGLTFDGAPLLEGMEKPEEWDPDSKRDQNLKRLYEAAGYSPDNGDAENMVRFTKTLTRNSLTPQADPKEKEASQGVITALYNSGRIDEAQYRAALSDLGYSASAIDYYVLKAAIKADEEEQKAYLEELKGNARIRPVTDDELNAYSNTYDISITEKANLRRQLDRISKAIVKQPTVAQLNELVEGGNISAKEYRAALSEQGYSNSIVDAFSRQVLGLGTGLDYQGFAAEMIEGGAGGKTITQQNFREIFNPKTTPFISGTPNLEDNNLDNEVPEEF